MICQSSRNNNKSTLFIQAGLISIFLCYWQLANCQEQRFPKVDSLIGKALRIRMDNFSAADSIYDLASQMIVERGVQNYPTLYVSLLHHRAVSALLNGSLSSTRNYLEQSYAVIDKSKPLPGARADSLTAQTQLIQATYFYFIGSYENALQNLDRVQAYLRGQQESRSKCESYYQALQYQASIYLLQGEYESCIDRYLASIPYYDCYRSRSESPNYILVYRNIGQAYIKKRDFDNARKFLMSAKANLDTCSHEANGFTLRNHALILYHSLADFYLQQKKTDSAYYYIKHARKYQSGNLVHASRIDDVLARIAIQEKNYEMAQGVLKNSLNHKIQVWGPKHDVTANAYRSISSLYLTQNDYINALVYIQHALSSLSLSIELDSSDYWTNPSIALTLIPKEMLMTLHQKATILTEFYKHKQSRKYLEAARNTNLLALQLLDSTRNEFSLEKDKVVLGEDAVKVYQTGLQIATLLYSLTNDQKYLSECFDLIDKSKSAVLMDHIKLVKNFSGLPSELLDRERELKVELSEAEQRLFNAELKKEETSSHRQQFGEIKKAYTTLLNDIKQTAPNYYKLRIENNNLSLPEAQALLAQDEALVEYFLSDSVLYTMVVTRETSKVFTAGIDSIREQVEAVRTLLTNPSKFSTLSFQNQWKQRIDYLSAKLVSPWQESIPSTKRIIIVPHDVLNYLPFEMLHANKAGDVLVNSIAISYASSASLLREQKKMQAAGNFFAGFNADYSNQKDLPQLTAAMSEVNSIKDIFGFRSSLFSAATADDFRREAARYKVIHLALHSLVNDEKPMFSRLVFTQTPGSENSDITANELYSMELNAEIAVLSACETGLGKLQRGEGMMSLSRAFMYAGVPSTVISLWKVPDQSASLLMTKFYRHLKAGQRKDEALRLAKLEFVEEHPEMSHPFFWAGFIVNGKTDPVSLPYFTTRESFAISTTIVLTILIILLVMLRRKRRAVRAARSYEPTS